VRGLSGEQIFDSLSVAVGYYEPPRQPYAFYGDDDPRSMFTTLFAAGNETGPDRTTSILQTLAMMNGRFTGEATSLQGSQTLGAIVEFPLMTTAERIEALYLATLSRRPRPDELARFVPYVDNAGERQAAEAAKLETPRTGAPPAGAAAAPSPDEAAAAQKQALADLFWALLNSSEFLFNH